MSLDQFSFDGHPERRLASNKFTRLCRKFITQPRRKRSEAKREPPVTTGRLDAVHERGADKIPCILHRNFIKITIFIVFSATFFPVKNLHRHFLLTFRSSFATIKTSDHSTYEWVHVGQGIQAHSVREYRLQVFSLV